MGGNQSEISSIGTQKGEGYRIINVRPNSPLQTHVDVFFDFIIDAIPLKQPERNPRQILDKLTQTDGRRPQKIVKTLQQLIKQNQNKPITLKIVSTKYRNVKNVEITPNGDWNGKEDLIGIQTRLQRYDEAFQTYFPVCDIRLNSPIKKSGIKEGEFLIGCREFKYCSINQFLENLYDRFFDKAVQNKNVNLAMYNISNDQLKIVPVLLARGWGDKGLLGCQFLQGHLNKFPKNLAQIRSQLNLKKKQSDDNERLKKQLSNVNGASVQLIQSLKAQKKRNPRTIKQLKNILFVQPAPKPPQKQQPKIQQNLEKRIQSQEKQVRKSEIEYVPLSKFKQVEDRVSTLQEMLKNVKSYLQNLGEAEEQQEI